MIRFRLPFLRDTYGGLYVSRSVRDPGVAGMGIDRSVHIGAMIEVEPEAFGLDEPDAPRLGCASTRDLLEELSVRMVMSQDTADGHAFGLVCEEAMRRLDPYVLDYRTVDI